MNDFFKIVIQDLKKEQETDLAQIERYKALTNELKEKTESRAMAIKLMEASINPEKRNDTLADILK